MMKNNQKILVAIVLCLMLYVLWLTARYWMADYYYNYGKNYNAAGYAQLGEKNLLNAIKLQPNQALYRNELAVSYALLSKSDPKYVDEAVTQAQKALQLSSNINIVRTQFGIYIRLSEADPKYLIEAKKVLDKSISLSPNDPKLIYNLGLMYARTGQNEEAVKILNKALELKPNYDDPKKALQIISEEKEP